MTWTIEDIVAQDVVGPTELRLGFDGNNEAHVGWMDGASSAKQKHAWRNAGTWQVETVATGIDGSSRFAVRDDLLVWAYTATNGNDLELHITSAAVGGSWSDSTVYTWVAANYLTYYEALGADLDVAIDSTGAIHVLACVSNVVFVPGYIFPWGKTLHLSSASWSPTTISQVGTGSSAVGPTCDELQGGRAIAIDNDDAVHCFWHEVEYVNSPNYDDLKYATSANSWSVETVHHDATMGLAESHNMNLAIDGSGVAHAIYYINDGSAVDYYDKQAWGSPQTLGWVTECAGLVVPGSDVWTCDDGGSLKLDFRSYSAGAWGKEAITALDGMQADIAIHPVDVVPWIAFGSDDKIKVAFRARAKPWWFLI